MIACAVMLSLDQPVVLHLLDIPHANESLNGVKMELIDAAFPLLQGSNTDMIFFSIYVVRIIEMEVYIHGYRSEIRCMDV
mgnify:CR=1 FL=1